MVHVVNTVLVTSGYGELPIMHDAMQKARRLHSPSADRQPVIFHSMISKLWLHENRLQPSPLYYSTVE